MSQDVRNHVCNSKTLDVKYNSNNAFTLLTPTKSFTVSRMPYNIYRHKHKYSQTRNRRLLRPKIEIGTIGSQSTCAMRKKIQITYCLFKRTVLQSASYLIIYELQIINHGLATVLYS